MENRPRQTQAMRAACGDDVRALAMTHWSSRPRTLLPHFDFIEAVKSFMIWTVGIIYSVMIVGIVVFGIWLYTASPSNGHDFYPPECCSGRDCAPLPLHRVHRVIGGYLIDGIHFASEAKARVSPDGKYHGCFPTPDVLGCFFAPKPSM